MLTGREVMTCGGMSSRVVGVGKRGVVAGEGLQGKEFGFRERIICTLKISFIKTRPVHERSRGPNVKRSG